MLAAEKLVALNLLASGASTKSVQASSSTTGQFERGLGNDQRPSNGEITNVILATLSPRPIRSDRVALRAVDLSGIAHPMDLLH